LAGFVLLGVGAALWWGRAVSPPPLAPEDPLAHVLVPEAVALAPGLYLLGRTSPAATYVVDTREGLVLIDSGLEADAAEVCAQLAELGLDVGRLRAILLTHVHADHSLGAAGLRARTGAKIYAGRGDCRPLREGEPRLAFFSNYSLPEHKTHPTPVDVELAGDEAISFGEARFRAVAAPGHTPGSTCYLLERPDLRALFTGDVIMHLGPGGRGTLGTYAAYLPPAYRGNARDYLASLRRLRALPVPDLVLPGHPRTDAAPESPRLTAQRWQALLDQGIGELEQTLARYDADGANFLYDEGVPRKLLPGLYYLGDCAGSAVYALDTPRGVFLFDAPGGAALVDFLARRFRALGWEGRQPTAVLLTSADERATAGLAALAQASGCRVVSSPDGVAAVRGRCPAAAPLLTTENLERSGWFEVRAIPLQGRGLAPVAYRLRWAGKTVLVSGRIPIRTSLQETEQFERDVGGAAERREQYRSSLARLAAVSPDLWLPAIPVEGQNANLYDQEWTEILAKNRKLVEVYP
jgi:glyoxylase-like metal-dependent hydrolase (beta-lactamase superfamily II)